MTAREKAFAVAFCGAIEDCAVKITRICHAAGFDPTHVETVVGLFTSSMSARAVYLTNVEAILGPEDAMQARRALDALLLLAAQKAEGLDTTALLAKLRPS